MSAHPSAAPASHPFMSLLTRSIARFARPEALASAKVLRTEVLAGFVVAVALIPEAISFSLIVGVEPSVGLFASATMAVVISVVGGRRAMISAVTGAAALVVAPLNHQHGMGYLIGAVVMGGFLQILLGALGVARLMRFIPRSVMVGFVNSLAILIFLAQVPELTGVPWAVYPLVALGLAIMVLLPRFTRALPAPLVSLAVLTVFTVAAGIAVPTVGDRGEVPSSLPVPGLPQLPLTLEALGVVAPYALAFALVGLMESLMTAKLVDDLTDTHSGRTRESVGQGVANVVTGLCGGMGGCATIGPTMINVRVGGARTRLSTFLAGVFLLAMCLLAGPVVAALPMAALVAVMITVSVATFDWRSVHPRTLARMPVGETVVMAVTVVVVVVTHNLAIGVVVGVLAATVAFARRVAHRVNVSAVVDPDGRQAVYAVTGELFFASANDLVYQFDYRGDPDDVVIDLSDAHIWDASSVATLDAIETKYRARGKKVTVVGLNEPSAAMRRTLAGRLTSR